MFQKLLNILCHIIWSQNIIRRNNLTKVRVPPKCFIQWVNKPAKFRKHAFQWCQQKRNRERLCDTYYYRNWFIVPAFMEFDNLSRRLCFAGTSVVRAKDPGGISGAWWHRWRFCTAFSLGEVFMTLTFTSRKSIISFKSNCLKYSDQLIFFFIYLGLGSSNFVKTKQKKTKRH